MILAAWLIACGGSEDLAPRDLDETATTLWAEGDWYDLGRVAILITSSGVLDCEEFLEPQEMLEEPLSTLYQDDGTFHLLSWERVEVPADSGLAPDAEFPGFEGLWTVAGDGPGWRSELRSTVFHDGQLSDALPSGTWLSLETTAEPGPVNGTYSTGQVEAAFSADHCGETLAYRVF